MCWSGDLADSHLHYCISINGTARQFDAMPPGMLSTRRRFIACHFFRATRSQCVIPALPHASPLSGNPFMNSSLAPTVIQCIEILVELRWQRQDQDPFRKAWQSRIPLPTSSAFLPFARLELRSTLCGLCRQLHLPLDPRARACHAATGKHD